MIDRNGLLISNFIILPIAFVMEKYRPPKSVISFDKSDKFDIFTVNFNQAIMSSKPHKTNLPGAYRCLFSCLMFYA
jgi:hypothetical protein